MKKMKYIICIILFIITLPSSNIYAKYKYTFEKEVISLTRDNNPINFTVTYSETDWTNNDVTITISLDKEVEISNAEDGWILSENNKTIVKTVSENESGTIMVEDLSGNKIEILYEVSNIDKDPPQIIGAQNDGIYNTDVELDYKDNEGIKSIDIDKYGELAISCLSHYFDTEKAYGIDINNSSIKVKVTSHPKGTKYYKYYFNEDLYAISENNEFTFLDLNLGLSGIVRVEAVDKNNNIIETKAVTANTSYFENIIVTKTDTGFTATYYGISNEISKISYAIWNISNHQEGVMWQNAIVDSNRSINISMNFSDFVGTSDIYMVHAYFRNSNNETLYKGEITIQKGKNYIANDNQIDKYHLTQNGNYQIVVEDLAGNITEYNITIEK